MSESTSQRQEILSELLAGRTMTPLRALEVCGCFRLAARIHELRRQWHRITKTMHRRGYSVYALDR